ncbi:MULTISPECIES: hypothetical protein [Pantoea]|jgi:hypothetical protein|uniref:hypothetical protein n=1 Tax=Pantoea TaxID=53335 RepID=UPI001E358E9D|nr:MULTISPECIES: hypothetical protein [Pantoea]MDJ0021775.1 hypothetical protein [Pantoea eucrina]
MMQSEQTAPCPAIQFSLPDPLWDTRPDFAVGELEALDTLISISGRVEKTGRLRY